GEAYTGGGGAWSRHSSGRRGAPRSASADMVGGSGSGSGSGSGVPPPGLRISSASPGSSSTAVPTPAAATPGTEGDQGSRGDRVGSRKVNAGSGSLLNSSNGHAS
ncbi:unnamed protein product, partial [Scytosiphon promiscuus]